MPLVGHLNRAGTILRAGRCAEAEVETDYSGAAQWSASFATMGFNPFTVCGIFGAGCFIASYFGALQGWLEPSGWRFPAVNLLGATLVLVSLMDAWNLPSVVLECFWGAISVYGLARNWRS